MVGAALWLREVGSRPSANTQAVGGQPPGKCEGGGGVELDERGGVWLYATKDVQRTPHSL